MLVEKIEKAKKGMYKITVDGDLYLFSDDTIVEYRLTVGHETTLKELEEAKKTEELARFYKMAVSYEIRYAKGERRVREYLFDKGASNSAISIIIEKMKKTKIINDNMLIKSLISSLARKGNGKALIKEKLYQRGFDKEDIQLGIDEMDLVEYRDGLIKLFNKIEHKYDKYDSFIKKEKQKAYLLGRGYSYSDISFLF